MVGVEGVRHVVMSQRAERLLGHLVARRLETSMYVVCMPCVCVCVCVWLCVCGCVLWVVVVCSRGLCVLVSGHG